MKGVRISFFYELDDSDEIWNKFLKTASYTSDLQ